MHPAEETLTLRMRAALLASFGPEFHESDPQIAPSRGLSLGTSRRALPLRLAKPAGFPPRVVGERLLAALDVDDLCLIPDLAGRGFINFTLRPQYLAGQVSEMLTDDRLGVEMAAPRSGWSSTTPRRTWPRRCTSGISGPPSSATPSPVCSPSSATRDPPEPPR